MSDSTPFTSRLPRIVVQVAIILGVAYALQWFQNSSSGTTQHGTGHEEATERSAPRAVVKLTGVTSTEGTVQVAIYSSAENFLDPTKADYTARASANEVDDGTVTIRLDDSVFDHDGQVAITAFHDRNDDGKLGKNVLGVPNEPYGFSNGARNPFGPPTFQQAAVELPLKEATLSIELK